MNIYNIFPYQKYHTPILDFPNCLYLGSILTRFIYIIAIHFQNSELIYDKYSQENVILADCDTSNFGMTLARTW